MSKISEQIGLRLRAARRAASFKSARTFATQHKIPESTYSQHETGKRSLNPDMLLRYSELLDIDPGWLLTGEGVPYSCDGYGQEQQECIKQKILNLKNYVNVSTDAVSVTNNDPAVVDVQLFSEILRETAKVIAIDNIHLTSTELLEFCSEVYNSVVSISIDQQNRRSVINISIASLRRGLRSKGKNLL